MPVTYASAPINDQLIPVFEGQGIWGLNQVGPVFHGNGQRPPQSIPTGITSSPMLAPSATPATSFVNTTTTGNATMLFVVAAAMLIIGLLGLRYIHWRH